MQAFTSPRLFRNTLFSLLICSLLITLCYFWVDPALAFWVDHENWRQFPIFDYCTHLVDIIMAWSALYYCYFAWSFSSQKKKPQQAIINDWPLLNVANSVAISIFIKDALKAPFGRYWPSTWVNNNPSLIHDNAYGFHWFHKGVIYQSFPSGHTTVAVAAMTAIWITFPREIWRWVALLVAASVIVGLIADDYHFLGDCIAGAWVGGTVAIYVTAYTKRLLVNK